MKKMMKRIIVTLLAVASTSIYANPTNVGKSCMPLTDDDVYGVMIFSYTGQKEIVSQLLNKYCYDSGKIKSNKDNQAYMFAKDIGMLKLFQEKGVDILADTTNHNQDLLSYYLLAKNTYATMTKEEEKTFLSKYVKKYGLGSLSASNEQMKLTAEKRKEIVSYLSSLYKNNAIARNNQDHYGNTVFHYAVYTAEPNVLRNLILDYKATELLRKNHMGLTPLHLMFIKKDLFDESSGKENVAQLNQFMEPYFKTTYFNPNYNLLRVNNLTFVDFIELMKDNNLGLYNAISKSYNFKVSNEFISLPESEKEKLRKNFEESTKYGSFFKKQ